MNPEKTLKKYFTKRHDAINDLLQKREQVFVLEDFHRLRAEIKKLHALFTLASFCEKDFKGMKLYKGMKKLFLHAGTVRELQLNEKILKKYNSSAAFTSLMAYLKKRELEEREAFFSLRKKAFEKTKERAGQTVLSVLKNIKQESINIYIKKKRKKIKILLSHKTLKTKQVHKLRKELKEYYYTLKFLSIESKRDLLKRMSHFQNLIGEWHDLFTINRHFNNTLKEQHLNKMEKNRLKKLISKLVADRERLFCKINEEVNSRLVV